MNNKDQCREAFEKWAGRNGWGFQRHGEDYIDERADYAYSGWKAAYNAPCVATKEIVDKVGRAVTDIPTEGWPEVHAKAALRAAGFVIEGD